MSGRRCWRRHRHCLHATLLYTFSLSQSDFRRLTCWLRHFFRWLRQPISGVKKPRIALGGLTLQYKYMVTSQRFRYRSPAVIDRTGEQCRSVLTTWAVSDSWRKIRTSMSDWSTGARERRATVIRACCLDVETTTTTTMPSYNAVCGGATRCLTLNGASSLLTTPIAGAFINVNQRNCDLLIFFRSIVNALLPIQCMCV